MAPEAIILVLSLVISQTLSSINVPQIPSGRRSQFVILKDNGSYKYGYDTGDGYAAKQTADSSNQVSGFYAYKNAAGQDVGLKYTAGVQGFVPEGLDSLQTVAAPAPNPATVQVAAQNSNLGYVAYQGGPIGPSYSYTIDTSSQRRQQSGGAQDFTYATNAGFIPISGSLTRTDALNGGQAQTYNAASVSVPSSPGYSYPVPVAQPSGDSSYAFAYNTGDSSREESADINNNVRGRYSYTNNVGTHDLSYVAGSATGFQVTGGSLAQPNGLNGVNSLTRQQQIGTAYYSPIVSYSYLLPAASIVTSAASSGEQNLAGNIQASIAAEQASNSKLYSGQAVSFSIDTASFKRQQEALAAAKLQSTLSRVNQDSQDVSLVAGLQAAVVSNSVEQVDDDQSNTGDASYNFSFDAGNYRRQESSDAAGNVKGTFSYIGQDGTQDLSFVAGAQTGFVPTGGSLATPVAPPAVAAVKSSAEQAKADSSADAKDDSDEANTGDASYNFTIDTDDYRREESSDAQGNIRGSYSYKNSVGNHDLTYVAGSATGFLPTGGSLKPPPGLTDSQLRAGESLSRTAAQSSSTIISSPVVQSYSAALLPSPKSGNIVVKAYLPPNDRTKYGYVYDTV